MKSMIYNDVFDFLHSFLLSISSHQLRILLKIFYPKLPFFAPLQQSGGVTQNNDIY